MEQGLSFGYWVRRRRKALDLTQTELAKQVFCALSTIKKIELGERFPSPQMAERLAECLHILGSERELFLKTARADLSIDQLPLTSEPVISKPRISNLASNQPLTPFIGYEDELAQITELIKKPDTRLITLVGPGGIGKTRLAIEAAFRLTEDTACLFCEGIYYISLVAFSSPDALIPAIADALNLPILPDPDQRTQQVLNYLQTKRLLLLLDNFEHLIDSQNIQVLVDVLTHAPQVKLLITSRTHLNTQSEYIIPLHGLKVPTAQADDQNISIDTAIEQYSAVRLFLTRAKQIKPELNITINDLKSIIQICQILEGMPLGIELSVAWLDVLSPTEIVDEINRCLDFLSVNWPDRPERHQSLRAVFDGSWKLLGEPERDALMNLTVFQGSFSRQAAQAVSGASIQLLMSLHSKSLLQIQNNRYQIHELLCQYANEYLQAKPSTWQLVREQYCTYYADFLEQQSERIKGPQQREAYNAISSEYENIRLAWQWSVEAGQVEQAVQRMLLPLFRYAEARAMPYELTQLLDQALAKVTENTNTSPPHRLQSILLIAQAAFNVFGYPLRLGYTVGNTAQENAIRQAWQLSGDVEILKTMGFWGMLLLFLYGLLVDPKDALIRMQELITYIRAQNRRWDLAYALYLYGSILVLSYKYFTKAITIAEEAEPSLKEALSIFQELSDKSETGYVMEVIGILYKIEGRYLESIDTLKTAQAYLDEVGELVINASILSDMVDSYDRLGNREASFQCFQVMSQMYLNVGQLTGAAHALSMESLHALRYSEIDHALRTRQKSLSLYQQARNTLGEAWATWEMGEIYRVDGDPEQSKEWFEKSYVLFKNYRGLSIDIFIERSLAEIAEMSGDHINSGKHFEESASHARQINHQWALSYALCGWGVAEIGAGNIQSALQHFNQAIQIARELDENDLVLNALAGYTKVLVLAGDFEQAVELGTWIINHLFCWNETKSQVQALLDSISITPERFVAAQERSLNLDITDAISRVSQAIKNDSV